MRQATPEPSRQPSNIHSTLYCCFTSFHETFDELSNAFCTQGQHTDQLGAFTLDIGVRCGYKFQNAKDVLERALIFLRLRLSLRDLFFFHFSLILRKISISEL
jgi:hypothetical protein